MNKETVYLLFGGNLGDCPETFRQAREAVSGRVGVIEKASELFTSPAWGFTSENLFYNQAIAVCTGMEPHVLLRTVLAIEKTLGRVRPKFSEMVSKEENPLRTYASRKIDIDILFYGNQVICSEELTVPHPLLQERAFALLPLSRIAPSLVHPLFGKTVAQLLEECPDEVGQVRML